MFISIKSTGSHEDNLRADRSRYSGAQFFVIFVWNLLPHVRHKENCTSWYFGVPLCTCVLCNFVPEISLRLTFKKPNVQGNSAPQCHSVMNSGAT